MTDKIIKTLNRLNKGGKYHVTKDDPQDERDVIYKLESLGVLKKDRFIYSVNSISDLSKVIELKSVEKYIKWKQKPQKKPMTNFEKLYLLLTFILVCLAVFQYFQNNSLTTERDYLNYKLDSLNREFDSSERKIYLLSNKIELLKKDSISESNLPD